MIWFRGDDLLGASLIGERCGNRMLKVQRRLFSETQMSWYEPVLVLPSIEFFWGNKTGDVLCW